MGFLPYRKISYIFEVIVMDETGTRQLTEVQAGQNVQLWITPKRLDGKPFDAPIDSVSISLSSNFDLLTPSGEVFNKITQSFQGTSKSAVMFTKVPPGGFEGVEVSGQFTNPNDLDISFGIRGSSEDIRVLPGPPEKIAFQKPPSNGVLVVETGTTQSVEVQALDKYENKINTATSITLVSERPEIGNVVESPVSTNDTGLAVFRVLTTGGNPNDTFPIVATLVVNQAKDHAKIVVGKRRDKFWVFYGDVGAQDLSVGINGCSGTRVPVTIWASTDGTKPLASQNVRFAVELSAGLVAYESENPKDTVRVVQSSLKAGEKTLWIKSTAKNVANGSIAVYANDGSVTAAERGNINFVSCNASVKRAAYFASNGRGAVDRVEIYFDEKFKSGGEIPDSIRFFWPSSVNGTMRLVDRAGLTLDPKDSSHITVLFAEPFPDGVTKYIGTNLDLGTFYWWNAETPEAPTFISPFPIADSVGPLLTGASLVERLRPGNDTLVLDFSETVLFSVVAGKSLVLIKGNSRDTLEVVSAVPDTDGVSIIAVVKDLGTAAPAAGDSLMINGAGPVVDGFGSHAHPDNRPVPLLLRQRPADIVSAWYLDADADGFIDRAIVQFNKKVDRASIGISLDWRPGNKENLLKGTVPAESVQWIDESQTSVMLDIGPLFRESGVATSGTMNIRVDFPLTGDSRGSVVSDSAAPVLTSAKYYFGQAGLQNSRDTVKFGLSEVAKVQTTEKVPLKSVNEAGEYTMTLNFLRETGDLFIYVVESIQGGSQTVLERDSVWINTQPPAVSDNFGAVQANPANRRVPLVMVLTSDVVWGPNPFSRGSGTFTIMVKVRGQTTNVSTSLKIFDKVGNLVKEYAWAPGRERIWDGTNNKNRRVGSGTYLGIFSHTLEVNGEIQRQPVEKIYIGMKEGK